MIKIGKNILFFFSFFWSFFLALTLFAAPEVKLELHPDQVGVGDQARLILTVTSNEDFENEDPILKDVDGFQILQSSNGGRSSSSRMNFINGKADYSKTIAQHYEFVIQFTKAGQVQIGPMTIQIDGQKRLSNSVGVQVAKSSQQSVQQRGNTGARQKPKSPLDDDSDPFGQAFGQDDDDMFSQLMKQRQKMLEEMQKQMQGGAAQGLGSVFGQDPTQIPNLKLDVNTNESFFVHADVDKTTAYEGEQVTVNWYIYVKGNIESLDRAKFPDLKGFWKEIIEEVPGLQFAPARVNGIEYKRALLASHALFPIKAGVSVIDEFKIKATVRNLTQFGWGKPNEFTKSSKRIPIQVLPLPQDNKPQSFSGAVGQFQIQTVVDTQQVKANQPFSLRLRFEGFGNAKLIEMPPVQWPDNLSVFDTKSDSKFFKNGQSFKEFEILLVQSKKGEFKIPSIQFSYFDPQQKKYITKVTEEMTMTAAEGDPLAASSTLVNSKNGNPAVAEIRPIMEWPSNNSWLNYRNYFFMLLGSAVFLILLIQFIVAYGKLKSNPDLMQKLQLRINKIDHALKENQLKQVGSECVQLIYMLVESFSDHKTVSADSSDLSQKLNELPLEIKSKYGSRLTDSFQYFQMVGFAPENVRQEILSKNNTAQKFEELKKVVTEISDKLRSSN